MDFQQKRHNTRPEGKNTLTTGVEQEKGAAHQPSSLGPSEQGRRDNLWGIRAAGKKIGPVAGKTATMHTCNRKRSQTKKGINERGERAGEWTSRRGGWPKEDIFRTEAIKHRGRGMTPFQRKEKTLR